MLPESASCNCSVETARGCDKAQTPCVCARPWFAHSDDAARSEVARPSPLVRPSAYRGCGSAVVGQAGLEPATQGLEWRLRGPALLNLILVRLGYSPVIVLKQQRPSYLAAMQKADSGDCGPLGELLARAFRGKRR